MLNFKIFLRESNAIEGVWDELSLKKAVKAWYYLLSFDNLTIENVLKVHDILMVGHLPPEERGTFRKEQVWIGGREGKPWYVIPELIANWVTDANASVRVPGKDGIHIKLDHINYEKIHPFIDGNGRTGRIFWQWQRVKAGLPVEIIWEKEKRMYYNWFMEG